MSVVDDESKVAFRGEHILWLKPGTRVLSLASREKLFAGYTSVCTARRLCRIAVPSQSDEGPGKQVLAFKVGDVIAATDIEHEQELEDALGKQGLTPIDASFGESPSNGAKPL